MRARQLLKTVIPDALLNARRRWQAKRLRKQQIASLSLAQGDQDYWVYGEVFNEMKGGYFVDIGAYDGVFLSNTFLLEQRYGWRGICVEANPGIFPELQRNRDCACLNLCLDREAGEASFAVRNVYSGILASDCDNWRKRPTTTMKLKTYRLDDLLRKEKAPDNIDYLSIDIEGAEDRVLLDFPFNEYVFKCLTIERPSPKLRELLRSKGYVLIKELPRLDCYYIHESFKEAHRTNLDAFGRKRFYLKPWT